MVAAPYSGHIKLAGILIMLKTVIVVLMIALVASLASGLVFLMSDQGSPDKKRLFTSLGVRLGLGVCLLLVILYGVMTGQLGHQNPWDPGPVNPEGSQQ
ncbi:MAG: DUF2909 domain-containing protein [Luminiphilus sp.]